MSTVLSIAEWTRNWADHRQIENSFFEQVPSTNDVAKQNVGKEKNDVKIYIADEQTHGRGRGPNTWLSPSRGQGLMCTWSLRLDTPPLHTTGPRCGMMLLKASQECWPGLKWSLKAPNDLYLDQGKVAGILAESVSQGDQHRLIFGLGMNVGDCPQEIPTATCLMSESGIGADLKEKKWHLFLDHLYSEIHSLRDQISKTLSEQERSFLLQALNANPYRPFLLVDISPDGDLIAEDQKISWTEL